jgi:hypothetical protein
MPNSSWIGVSVKTYESFEKNNPLHFWIENVHFKWDFKFLKSNKMMHSRIVVGAFHLQTSNSKY